jgi:hypothetical protein
LFVQEFDLVQTKEMAPLQSIVDKINADLKEKDKKEKETY